MQLTLKDSVSIFLAALLAAGATSCSSSIVSPGNQSTTLEVTASDSNAGTSEEGGTQTQSGTEQQSGVWISQNGKPFLPITVWNQPHWRVDDNKALGINTFFNNGLGPPEDTNRQLLDELQVHDMYAFLTLHDPNHPDFNYVKNHPNLIAWAIGDEPDGNGVPPSAVQQQYNLIRNSDPEHPERPVILNVTGSFYYPHFSGSADDEDDYFAYFDITEWISFDHYPVAGWNQPGWLHLPGAMTDFLINHYLGGQKPVQAIIESCDQHLPWVQPAPSPTPEQMRFEVWDSLISGAVMIGYFTISLSPFSWNNMEPELETEMTRTNLQITTLTDVILSHPPILDIQVTEANNQDVHYMARKQGDDFYLFALNADINDGNYRSASVTFTFDQPPQTIEVYDENRFVTASGTSFTDEFDPLEVHIYKISF